MSYKLFIAVDVLEFIERLPRKTRLALRSTIAEIGDHPIALSDATDYDNIGRMIQITICGDYALIYWVDEPDQHVKILDIHSADR